MKFPALFPKYCLLPLLLALGSSCSLQGAMDMFIKLDGIEGESLDSVHKGASDVLSWSWGGNLPVSQLATGGGGGSVQAKIQDLSISKYVDKASPKLIELFVKGISRPEAVLTIRRTIDGNLQEFMVISMRDVLVTSFSTSGRASDDRLTETVTLNFGSFDVTYSEWDPNDPSRKAGNVEMTWNITTNSP